MARLFISHRLTGEDPKELVDFFLPLAHTLELKGHQIFCSALCQQEMNDQKLNGYASRLHYCLAKQDSADLIIGVIRSELPSNGMREELEKAKLLKQGYLLCIKEGLSFQIFREYAETIITFSELQDLIQQLNTEFAHQA